MFRKTLFIACATHHRSARDTLAHGGLWVLSRGLHPLQFCHRPPPLRLHGRRSQRVRRFLRSPLRIPLWRISLRRRIATVIIGVTRATPLDGFLFSCGFDSGLRKSDFDSPHFAANEGHIQKRFAMIRKYSLACVRISRWIRDRRVVFVSTCQRCRRCSCRQRQMSRDEHHRGRKSQPNSLPVIRGRNDRIVHAGRVTTWVKVGK